MHAHTQPSSLQQSEIDRYLQGELETMRRAFQIRLAQLEKRYQRQLRLLQQRQNSASGPLPSIPADVQLRAQRKGVSLHRRSSWHSCLSDSDTEDVEPDQLHRSGSSQGFDSDCNVESDNDYVETEDQFMLDDPYRGHGGVMTGGPGNLKLQRTQSLGVKPTAAQSEGLKGGTRMRNVEPGNGARAGPLVSPVQGAVLDEVAVLSPDAKALVNERVSEHRERILQYFQQVHSLTYTRMHTFTDTHTHTHTHIQYTCIHSRTHTLTHTHTLYTQTHPPPSSSLSCVQVSEAKIASIEQQYEMQMNEVENRYSSQASEKLSQLETRVKDLEKMLDIETLV